MVHMQIFAEYNHYYCTFNVRFMIIIFLIFLDINECIANTNNCSQVCVNNDGGFTCSCKEGYRLANDRISCEGTLATERERERER